MRRSEKFYHNRLEKYLKYNYADVEDNIEWYVNPATNKWKFKVPGKDNIVLLTCDINGNITEEMILF